MQRRHFHHLGLGAIGSLMLATWQQAHALSLADLSGADAASGVKAALAKGAESAVALLGQSDGFLGNPKVRIPLPGYLEDAAKLMRKFGQGKAIDELITGMNRAAEAAVPMGKDLLVSAVQNMSVTDAKKILTGGDTSVTQFFAEKTRAPLGERFLPIVTQSIEKVGLAQQYNAFAGQAASFGVVDAKSSTVESYVTEQALDGLFEMIAKQEASIRQNPAGAATSLAKKVFGAL